MLDKRVDFAMNSFGMTHSRYEVINFLPTMPGGKGRIYIRNPRETFDWEVYTKPFRKQTWLAVIIFSILAPFLMMLVMVDGR